MLSRKWKERTILVEVLAKGFRFENQQYTSLSAIAVAVTSTRWIDADHWRGAETCEKIVRAFRSHQSRDSACAIYTRKSTEEGLDQESNSLDAQREAAEAFSRASYAKDGSSCPSAMTTAVLRALTWTVRRSRNCFVRWKQASWIASWCTESTA
jgi:hypothetical protein